MYGAIEAGGTKFNLAVCDESLNIIHQKQIPTTTPEETMAGVFEFFEKYPVEKMGIGSFGPIGVVKGSDEYGHILNTPKTAWKNFPFLQAMEEKFPVPTAWTTDVNAAAYGELKKGAAQGKKSCLYLTIGTGIGGGLVLDEQVFHGASHPEMGHIFIKRDPADTYKGTCPYHHDCLEGLAAGPSIEARTHIKGQNLPADHPVWDLQAYYLAQALVNYTLMVPVEKIVLGGGVMNQDHLLGKIRQSFLKQMNHYVEIENIDDYIVRWGLPNQSGIIGALLLAADL
ncbi:ROK family protein [Enterococcus timonensis]|uniref:ROK family protein n=1 Tax=Enterococcus timonensis TaxID=1852364 RepID=UPI0008D9F702|nr:ROK family protein [Enterococcus timonensis]